MTWVGASRARACGKATIAGHKSQMDDRLIALAPPSMLMTNVSPQEHAMRSARLAMVQPIINNRPTRT